MEKLLEIKEAIMFDDFIFSCIMLFVLLLLIGCILFSAYKSLSEDYKIEKKCEELSDEELQEYFQSFFCDESLLPIYSDEYCVVESVMIRRKLLERV